MSPILLILSSAKCSEHDWSQLLYPRPSLTSMRGFSASICILNSPQNDIMVIFLFLIKLFSVDCAPGSGGTSVFTTLIYNQSEIWRIVFLTDIKTFFSS